MPAADLTAIVLAGGAGRRLGGPGKPGLLIGSHSMLDLVLAACPAGCGAVVVGPRRVTQRRVRWTREDPPGGGPLAGLAAGLAEVTTPLVLVLATDLPAVAEAVPEVVAGARAALACGRDGAWAVDADGRPQPLVSCLATAPLRAAMPADPAGRSVVSALGQLRLDPVDVAPGAVADVDTPDQLEQVRQDVHDDAPPDEE